MIDTAAENARRRLRPVVGDEAPDFTADSTKGLIDFHKWLGRSWGVLLFHPRDFTPVCSTELAEAGRRAPDFKRRGAKLLAISADPLSAHRKWIADVEEALKTPIDFPVIADEDRAAAARYGVLHRPSSENCGVRDLFVVDPSKRIRLVMSYPPEVGRSFDELLRALDALQLADGYGVATPADWRTGSPCLIPPAIQDPAELARKFPDGHVTLKPYLRLAQPPRR